MKNSLRNWLHGLISAAITGLSTSFLSALGISAADKVGVAIPQLDAKQILLITVIGGAVGAAAYLKQSPLPKDNEKDSTT